MYIAIQKLMAVNFKCCLIEIISFNFIDNQKPTEKTWEEPKLPRSKQNPKYIY